MPNKGWHFVRTFYCGCHFVRLNFWLAFCPDHLNMFWHFFRIMKIPPPPPPPPPQRQWRGRGVDTKSTFPNWYIETYFSGGYSAKLLVNSYYEPSRTSLSRRFKFFKNWHYWGKMVWNLLSKHTVWNLQLPTYWKLFGSPEFHFAKVSVFLVDIHKNLQYIRYCSAIW